MKYEHRKKNVAFDVTSLRKFGGNKAQRHQKDLSNGHVHHCLNCFITVAILKILLNMDSNYDECT